MVWTCLINQQSFCCHPTQYHFRQQKRQTEENMVIQEKGQFKDLISNFKKKFIMVWTCHKCCQSFHYCPIRYHLRQKMRQTEENMFIQEKGPAQWPHIYCQENKSRLSFHGHPASYHLIKKKNVDEKMGWQCLCMGWEIMNRNSDIDMQLRHMEGAGLLYSLQPILPWNWCWWGLDITSPQVLAAFQKKIGVLYAINYCH